MLNLLLAWPLTALAEVSITDDQGREIRLDAPATRIIALYGAFNEILADLGCVDLLIARTAADDHPSTIVTKPTIGTHLRPNAELILALRPDLVIQLGGRGEAMEPVRFLEKRGLPVAVFDLENFEQLFSVMERLGTLTGTADQARRRVISMRSELADIEAQNTTPRPRVFFEARYPTLLAAGQGSMVSEIISRAGGENCVAAPDKLVRLGEEELLRLAPDIYLIQHGPMNPQPVPMNERPLFRTLACAASDQVHTVDQKIFSRPGPRSLEAVRQLATIISHWKKEARP
ncbi:MAG: ABC transporter substrate-binding protein [Desulfomicrobium sp.]|nr:ABC transporter substrate-binding protein [Pseudomonadota bacterium]MBV1713624.1 ABC transporter substrate-binding protein [Desulfomicrobium sp.]MBU4572160.1 ABC transporter substrate-binding protein [Pseudomonadota bacterium]MBU4594138.1 ABC transporter substrate-binding protein [Pseudomonadota bacterium]MBV1720911.1 ABC transporter substrate-binding protein [Desulfomicrobium sp.]